MTKKIEKEINRITNKIVEDYKPEKIILFGSAARGKFHEGSDLDFCIVKNSYKRRDNRSIDVFRILSELNRELPIDIIVYTPKEFDQQRNCKNSFVEDIVEEGKMLYETK